MGRVIARNVVKRRKVNNDKVYFKNKSQIQEEGNKGY